MSHLPATIGVNQVRVAIPGVTSCSHAHLVQREGVNHVPARQMHDDRTTQRKRQHVEDPDVVARGLVVTVDAHRIRGANQGLARPPEAAIRTRVMDVPHELFRGHANLER